VIILAKGADELGPGVAACLGADVQPIWIADEADLATEAAQEALSADLLIDAVIGTGFKPPLRGVAATAVAAINDAAGTVVSVDVPSGVDADSKAPLSESGGNMVFPHGILALIAPKPAHVFGELTRGPIAVSEIGVQPAFVANVTALNVITGQHVGIAFRHRENERQRRRFGHVLVVGGSLGQAGAGALAGLAAMNAGAGSVTVACPKSIQATVAGFGATLVTHGLPETEEGTIAAKASDGIDALLAGKDVVVIGSGLSGHAETTGFVRALARGCAVPLVVTAAGLATLAGHDHDIKPWGGASPFQVLMPDPAQAARLTGALIADIEADEVAAARDLANESGACVVLTGRRTVIAGASDEAWINMSGNPVLAKAGAADVLAGIVGAALARDLGDRAEAALQTADVATQLPQSSDRPLHHMLLNDLRVAAAVHLLGLAADIARDALHENSVTAIDLIDALAEAFRDCELQVERSLFYLRK
jgi:NAD(P)H-hydrate epimerase